MFILLVWVTAPFCFADGFFYPRPLSNTFTGVDHIFANDDWKVLPPYRSVGMVSASFFGGDEFVGTGVVAVDRKLLFSCAHVAYDRGRWASRIGFARVYNRQEDPSVGDFVYARGFRKLASYAPRGFDYDFEHDFTVAYLGSGFGQPVGSHPSPKAALLEEGTPKTILGYPSTIDHFEALGRYVPGFAYLHRTGPFATPFYQEYPLTGSYLGVDGVTTGPGNSGGPVMVQQEGQYLLAGILVSGAEDFSSAGIYALNEESDLAAQSALGAANAGTTRTIPFARRAVLRDGAQSYIQIRFNFSTMPPVAAKVVLRWTIVAANAQDIDAMLRSPEGVTVALPAEQMISGLDLTAEFVGGKANGIWTLYVRDAVRGGRSVLRRASLSLSSRWPD
jgi:hypothetical protein